MSHGQPADGNEIPSPSQSGEVGVVVRRLGGAWGMGQIRAALAQTTDDNDTRWLAIRGLGKVKFWEAPFLIDSLESGEHYVRVNATRALGELRCIRAAPTFIHLLEAD